MKIPITRPWFDEAEEQAVIQTLRSRYVSQGPRVKDFEKNIAAYSGASFAAAVSSCTAGLHIATIAADLGPGDEVLVPAFTWVSTINAVELIGARPVFCDIHPATYNIDAADALKRLSPKTKAMIPVHLFGLSADLTPLLKLSSDAQLTLIEDAACALGSYYKGKHVGTFGQIGCFSFHPRKSITTGEGGMVITSNESYKEKLLQLRNIGSDGSFPVPDFPVLGFNYRMNDLQAAIGLAQFQKLELILRKRREIATYYNELIGGSGLSEWLQIPHVPDSCIHSYQAYVCQIRPEVLPATRAQELRNQLILMLASEGTEIRPGTHAPFLLKYYSDKYALRPDDYPNAHQADRLTIALPLFAELTRDEQEIVCFQLRNSFHKLTARS